MRIQAAAVQRAGDKADVSAEKGRNITLGIIHQWDVLTCLQHVRLTAHCCPNDFLGQCSWGLPLKALIVQLAALLSRRFGIKQCKTVQWHHT